MSAFAARVQRDLEDQDRELWAAHANGEHAETEPECVRCARDLREL